MSAQLLEQVRENAALGSTAPALDREVEGLVNEVEVPAGLLPGSLKERGE